MKDINIVKIHNAVFYAFHGVADGEQDLGGKYEVDLEAYLDFRSAATNDSLAETLDYERAYNFIKDIVCKKKHMLIETVCYRIVDELFLEFSLVEKIRVKVRKYNPPLKGVVEYVEAEVIRER
jgi:7,8-dihydroneopterin aldolase/epimerase/oxygenase